MLLVEFWAGYTALTKSVRSLENVVICDDMVLHRGGCVISIRIEPVGWLVGWILWHINLCRLFIAKSIFIRIISSI